MLLDERTATRRVSVDLSLPAGAPRDPVLGSLIPIAFLRKTALINFDPRDERDNTVPLLTRQQNARVFAPALLQLADCRDQT